MGGSRRAYGLTLLALALGGLGLVVSFGLTWVTVSVPLLLGSEGAARTVDLTGRALLPWAGMAGWVALAAIAGIIATRSWGRVVVAVLGLLAGLVGVAGAVLFGVDPGAGAASAVPDVPAAEATVAGTTGAWLLAALAGLVVAAATGLTIVRGRAWPSLGSRYERGAREKRTLSDWDAQDLGQDPTDDLVE